MVPGSVARMNALRIFCVVVEERSWSGASKVLHMQPSSIQRQIAVLEKEFSGDHPRPLLTESRHVLSLTDDGEKLYLSVHQMVEDMRHGLVREDPDMASQRPLRICASTVFASFWLMPLMPRLLKKHPDFRYHLIVRDDEAHLNLSEADVLITWNELQPSFIVTEKIGEGRLRGYAHRRYIEKHGVPQTVEELDHHRIIAFAHNMNEIYDTLNPPLWLLSEGRPCGTLRTPYFSVNNIHCILQAIESGIGIGPSHQYTIPKNSRDFIEVLPLYGPMVSRYVCYPDHMRDLPSFQFFLDFMMSEIALNPL